MDHESFDALTRAVKVDTGTRRAAVCLLAGSMLGSLAAHLGLTEDAAAKRKRNHTSSKSKGHRRPDKHSSNDALQAQGKHKKNRRHKKPKDPQGDGPCPDGQGRCPDGTCLPWDACCPDAIPPLCRACEEEVCEGGTLVCRSRCHFSDSVCCNGECLLPCSNGCQMSDDCNSCSTAPAGKVYCPSQDRCVDNTSCPPGQDFDAATCQCKEHCPAVISRVCPPVPARDDWKGIFGDPFPLPQGCCGLRYWFEDHNGVAYCSTPGGGEPRFWKCDA